LSILKFLGTKHMENREIEVRFLEIDKEDLIAKIKALGGHDEGETMLEEIIFRPSDGSWYNCGKFIRLRDDTRKVVISYKHRKESLSDSLNNVDEIEIEVNSFENAKLIIENMGFTAQRFQQKLRHSFLIDGTVIDIDTWPNVPPYIEIESDSEENIKSIAERLGFDWSKVVFKGAGSILEEYYQISIKNLTYFTFNKIC